MEKESIRRTPVIRFIYPFPFVRRKCPPGTSKWNKIEHRLFSAISLNWRGRPLVNHEVVISLIEATTTRTGLKVRAGLDINHYPKGIKVTDAEMKALSHQPESFHGEWNYTIIKNMVN